MALITWGCDISIAHGGVVQLVNGKYDRCWYWTEFAEAAAKSKRGRHFKRPKCPKDVSDADQIGAIQRSRILEFMIEMFEESTPRYAGIERYAHNAGFRSHQIGEIGGMMRNLFVDYGVKWREHDPQTVKMFATDDGSADKDAVRHAVRTRWKQDYTRFDKPQGRAKKVDTSVSEDLSDAHSLSRLAYVEARLRSGKLDISKLREKQRRIFLRTTKTQPVNMLAREWVH